MLKTFRDVVPNMKGILVIKILNHLDVNMFFNIHINRSFQNQLAYPSHFEAADKNDSENAFRVRKGAQVSK